MSSSGDSFDTSSRQLEGIESLAESGQYDAWLLDQFGVLHDGKKAYPGAVETLQKLAKTGAKLILISNSSRRSDVTRDKLPSLGFDPSLFSGIVTSGELTHQYLQSREDPWFAALGRKCLHFTWSARGAISLEGLGLEVVESVKDADFILAHGTEALGLAGGGSKALPLAELEILLEEASKLPKKIPMIVANPDMVTVEVRALRVMPGTLGLKYEELGGEVQWMGKPGPIIYRAALEMSGIPPEKSIAVGDSLHHDVRGAINGNIVSVFVAGGIHANELKIKEHGEYPDLRSLENLIQAQNAKPTYVVPSFTW